MKKIIVLVSFFICLLLSLNTKAEINIVSWGGAYNEAQKLSFSDPYTAKTGAKINWFDWNDYPGKGIEEISKLIESNQFNWDILDLFVSKAQSLCLIGPNGAGKSTILHSIYGFTNIFSGKIEVDGKEITKLTPAEKLKTVGIAYILQDNSVFPDMTVEENLLMGGYIKDKDEESYQEAEKIFDKYESLRNRRTQPAKVLSGGERRLLEISRALVMKPSILLVDEPSIGLEPKYIEMVFEILRDLQQNEKKTIILVEQNAKKGLEFSDIGYVLVSGQTAIAGKGNDLLNNPDVGRLFLGG